MYWFGKQVIGQHERTNTQGCHLQEIFSFQVFFLIVVYEMESGFKL